MPTTSYQNEDWAVVRTSGPWARSAFIDAYCKIKSCEKIDATEFLKGAESDCNQKNIETVLEEMNKWAEENLSNPDYAVQGKFLIILDEAGLFFSAKTSRIGEMMSAAEWIHNASNKSRINMIFSAQQSFKDYFENIKGIINYKTAEQRFKKWFLDKKNITTVVINRWLKKDTQIHEKTLKKMVEDNFPKILDGTLLEIIKDPNLEYKKPLREDIVDTYPFVPHQFPLMIEVTQKLISGHVVEEQYGGKTRSILSMTRDVLNNTAFFSKMSHFVDEKFGYLVTLPQVYESLFYTLKKKDEDQFILVENSQKLEEDPSIFTEEERSLPFSFIEVMKSILLLNYVEEVVTSDQNIAKGLYYSISCDKDLILEKIKKIIEILKRKGFIGYSKKVYEDEKHQNKEVWEYRIASQEERKYIEMTQLVSITDEDIHTRLYNYFGEGKGNELISIRDSFFITKLTDNSKNQYSIANPVKLKCKWHLDPKLETLEANIVNPEGDPLCISIITPLSLFEWKNDLEQFEKKLKIITAKAAKQNRIFMFLTPELKQSIDFIQDSFTYLNSNLKECIRIDETLKKDQSIPGGVRLSFQQRVNDINEVLIEWFKVLLNSGQIIYGNQQRIAVSKDNINDKFTEVLVETFSQINRYAYLGQIKATPSEISTILKWDKKKKSTIPTVFRKDVKKLNTDVLFVFNEDGTDLQPNLAEQITHIEREFRIELAKDAKIDFVFGRRLFEIFLSSPYSWSVQTILASVAALIKNDDWSVMLGSRTFNADDKEILTAFETVKNNYEKFQELIFKVAEKLDQSRLNSAKDILDKLFNQQIAQIGVEKLNETIIKVSDEITDMYTDTKENIKKLELIGESETIISSFATILKQISEAGRPVERIKAFLKHYTSLMNDEPAKQKFLTNKQILYRISELKANGKIQRYYDLVEFHKNIMNDWLSTENNHPEIKNLNAIKEKNSQLVHDPAYLFDEKWEELWTEEKTVWEAYWEVYSGVHNKLLGVITEKLKELKGYPQSKNVKSQEFDVLKNIFLCKSQVNTPDSLEGAQFKCAGCGLNHSSLKLKEIKIEEEYQRLLTLITSIGPSGGINPGPDVVPRNPPGGTGPEKGSDKGRGEKITKIKSLLEEKKDTLGSKLLKFILELLEHPPDEKTIDDLAKKAK